MGRTALAEQVGQGPCCPASSTDWGTAAASGRRWWAGADVFCTIGRVLAAAALHMACANGHADIARLLLEANAVSGAAGEKVTC